MTLLALLLNACGPSCEERCQETQERKAAVAARCDLPRKAESIECSRETADLRDCQVQCMEDADCRVLNGSALLAVAGDDYLLAHDYSGCLVECSILQDSQR